MVNSPGLKHVKIEKSAVSRYAKELVVQFGGAGKNTSVFTSVGDGGAVDWDASGIHYCEDVASLGPMTVQYICVLSALNFCFWPKPGFEYDTLAFSLKMVLEKDKEAFNACKLANITPETVASWFPSDNPIPNLLERVDRLREIGSVLEADFGGSAANLVATAKNSAVALVKLILMHFSGFRDTVVHEGRLVHFYKRAQIMTADIWGAYGRPRGDESNPYCFRDIDQLTMFADYRVPQILRHVGILKYSEELARMIDSEQVNGHSVTITHNTHYTHYTHYAHYTHYTLYTHYAGDSVWKCSRDRD